MAPEGALWGSRRGQATLPHSRTSFTASSEGHGELGASLIQRGGGRHDQDVEGLFREAQAALGRLTDLVEGAAQLIDPHHEEVHGNLGEIAREAQAASATVVVCAEKATGLQHKVAQLSSKTAALEADLEQANELCEQAASYQKERDDGRRRVTVLEQEMHVLQEMHTAQRNALSSMQAERSNAQRRDEDTRRQTIWLEGAMEHAETRVSILTAEVSRLECELEKATIASRSYAALAEESDYCIMELQAELRQKSTEAWAGHGSDAELNKLRVQLREQEIATRVAKSQNEDLLRRMTLVSDMLAMGKDPPKEFYIGEADDSMSDVSTQLPGERNNCKASTGFLFSDGGTENTTLKSSPLVRAETSPKGELRTRIRNAMHAHQPASQGVSIGQGAHKEAAKVTSDEHLASRKVRASLPATKKSSHRHKPETTGGEYSFLPISW